MPLHRVDDATCSPEPKGRLCQPGDVAEHVAALALEMMEIARRAGHDRLATLLALAHKEATRRQSAP